MILTVDIGNSMIALTALKNSGEDYEVIFSEKIPSESQNFLESIRKILCAYSVSCKEISAIVLASVVPKLTEPVCRALEGVIGKNVSVINAGNCRSLEFAVAKPGMLGLDRIADSAWAAAHFSLPALTVDMGTATVFNVIGKGGVFLGGLIAAGIGTSLSALSEHTAQLPKLSDDAPPKCLIGKNTSECMLSGTVIGTAAMVDGIAARIEEELGTPVTLIVTGGGAELAEPFILRKHIYEPHLLAKGLAFIY